MTVGGSHNKLRVQLVGIAGTSRDVLLSIFVLKSFVLSDHELAGSVSIETSHHKSFHPSKLDEACADIMTDVTRFNPDVVGFSTYTWNYAAVIHISAHIKKKNPGIKIILGGPEIAASDVIKGKFDDLPIDYIICGEGEMPFLRFLRCMAGGDEAGLGKISRVARRVNGRFVHKDIEKSAIDMLPDLSGLPSAYLTGAVPASMLELGFQANIETQRGCNFRCAYCLYHSNFPSIRYRNVTDVVEELDYVYRHGCKGFRITDANFLSKRDFAAEILSELIRRNIRMSFFFEVIPSFVDQRIADLMRQYRELAPENRILVGIGLQTINVDSLKAIRRKLPLGHFTRAFTLLANAGVVIKTDIILGLPYETRTTYLELLEYTADKMRNGYNYLSLSLLRVLPGSELASIADAAGLVTDPADTEHFVYETPTMPRRDLVDCLRMSGVSIRLFHTLDNEGRIVLRDKYFEVKDKRNVSHAAMIRHFVGFFEELLAGTDSNFVKEDFPAAEDYWYFDMHKEISNDVLIRELDRLLDAAAGDACEEALTDHSTTDTNNKHRILEDCLESDPCKIRDRASRAFDGISRNENSPVVLFGAGRLGRKIAQGLIQIGLKPSAFSDNNPDLQGTTILGIPVYSPSDAAARFGKEAVFVVTIWRAFAEETIGDCKSFLRNLGCATVCSVFPVFWKYPRLFLPHCGADEPHKVVAAAERIRQVQGLWSDQASENEYVEQLLWRLDPEVYDLSRSHSSQIYFPPELMRLRENEFYVDCGGYDGDTARQFLTVVHDEFARMLIIEPDAGNFQRIREWIATRPPALAGRIAICNAAVGDAPGKVRFISTNEVDARICETGEIEVECETLDHLLDGKSPSFIKMDIEGAEISALKGGAGVIRRCRPILAICLYHRQSDIWEIPHAINEMVDDYRYYLRNHGMDGWELVLYAIPSERAPDGVSESTGGARS